MIVHRKRERGAEVHVMYFRPLREYPIYHGPALDPRRAHPFFPGTVLYVGAKALASGEERRS